LIKKHLAFTIFISPHFRSPIRVLPLLVNQRTPPHNPLIAHNNPLVTSFNFWIGHMPLLHPCPHLQLNLVAIPSSHSITSHSDDSLANAFNHLDTNCSSHSVTMDYNHLVASLSSHSVTSLYSNSVVDLYATFDPIALGVHTQDMAWLNLSMLLYGSYPHGSN
jgi:hypothetical protein